MTFDKQGSRVPIIVAYIFSSLFSNYRKKADIFIGSHNVRQLKDLKIKNLFHKCSFKEFYVFFFFNVPVTARAENNNKQENMCFTGLATNGSLQAPSQYDNECLTIYKVLANTGTPTVTVFTRNPAVKKVFPPY